MIQRQRLHLNAVQTLGGNGITWNILTFLPVQVNIDFRSKKHAVVSVVRSLTSNVAYKVSLVTSNIENLINFVNTLANIGSFKTASRDFNSDNVLKHVSSDVTSLQRYKRTAAALESVPLEKSK